MKKKMNRDTFWKAAVVVLLAVVGVQLWLTRAHSRTAQSTTTALQSDPIVQTPAQTANNSSQLQLKPLVSMNHRNPTTPVPAPSQQVAPRGVNPYDQPQLSSGRDMFRQMQQMAAQMMQDMDTDMPTHLLGNASGARMTSPVVESENDNYVVKMNIPGLDKSNVQARVSGNMLTISGVQTRENRKSAQGGNYYSSSSSQFQTSLSLPGPVKSDNMKVDYDNNVLRVILPKA